MSNPAAAAQPTTVSEAEAVRQSFNTFRDQLAQEEEEFPEVEIRTLPELLDIKKTLDEYRNMIFQQSQIISQLAATVQVQAAQLAQLQSGLNICRASTQTALSHAAIIESPMLEVVRQTLAETVPAQGQRIPGSEFNKRVIAKGAQKKPTPLYISSGMVYKLMGELGYNRVTIGNTHYYPNLAWAQ